MRSYTNDRLKYYRTRSWESANRSTAPSLRTKLRLRPIENHSFPIVVNVVWNTAPVSHKPEVQVKVFFVLLSRFRLVEPRRPKTGPSLSLRARHETPDLNIENLTCGYFNHLPLKEISLHPSTQNVR